jgi:hypothetical protein
MTQITGTFTGTGQSATITGQRVLFLLNFAGTASVNVEVQLPDTSWIILQTFTADGTYSWDTRNCAKLPFRLNCTAHTNNVYYAGYSEV